MPESRYQHGLIIKIQEMLPGCYILKNDPSEIQGIPDILILFGSQWAMLETKMAVGSRKRPNQDHYVRVFNDMSFAAFIYPEIEEEVLYALQSAFGVTR